MAGEMSEAYLEWLEREEETVGLGAAMRAATDIEEAKKLLTEELGYTPTDAQVEAFTGAGTMKYKTMPEIGVGFERIEHVWGKQSTYRDILTGRFVSPRYVTEAIARLEL
uniref:Uncharacterized protein n=1 Tax=viral metagenome TaxID=1070528 RepID=A0A6H1ZWF6_9ZZZZ